MLFYKNNNNFSSQKLMKLLNRKFLTMLKVLNEKLKKRSFKSTFFVLDLLEKISPNFFSI